MVVHMVAIKSKVVGKAEKVLYPCNGKCLATSLAKKIKENLHQKWEIPGDYLATHSHGLVSKS